MAQEINEIGTISAMVDRNVVFNKRMLVNLSVDEGNYVYVGIQKSSEFGDVTEMVAIDWENFRTIETQLWELIDSAKNTKECDTSGN